MLVEDFGHTRARSAGVASIVQDSYDLDLGIILERVLVTQYSLFQVPLPRDSEKDNLAAATDRFGQQLAPQPASVIVAGPDKEEARARWRVGIESAYRQALLHGQVNRSLQDIRVSGSNKNPRRFRPRRAGENLSLLSRIVDTGPHKPRLDT